MNRTVLDVKDLQTSFYTHLGEVQAIRGVSFTVEKGEALGIVGESGSGKSVTMLSVMRLLQKPGEIKSGQIIFKGQDLVKLSEKAMQKIRGNDISMIFQDPLTSLNPVFTVGDQIMESLILHQKMSRKKARLEAIRLLQLVEIPSAEERIDNYPHELSGGMQQRVMIAIALACQPYLLIADEPTTALDVTIQAQILDLMKTVMEKTNTGIILITHDLGVVADMCNRIMVMYGGLIMESGSSRDIFYRPAHPYTLGLLGAVPTLEKNREGRLATIPGTPPDLLYPPQGCPFAERCQEAMNICVTKQPPLFDIGNGHRVMCWLFHDEKKE